MSDNPAGAPSVATEPVAAAAPAPTETAVAPTAAVLTDAVPAVPETPVTTGTESVAAIPETPATATAPAEPAPAEPEPASYQPFTFPEDRPADPDLVKGATELFGADRLSQERAQKYIDYLNNEIMPRWAEQYAAQKAEADGKAFADTIKGWVNELEQSDIGGNRLQTTLAEARTLMNHFGGTDEQRARAYQVGAGSGAFNHPDIIRPLAQAGRFVADVLHATGARTPSEALRLLREPRAPSPALSPSAGRGNGLSAADQRYGRRS
jgi:hypothetical protein